MAKADEPKTASEQPVAAPAVTVATVAPAAPVMLPGPDGPVAPLVMWTVSDGTKTDIVEARSADAAKYVFMEKYKISDQTQEWLITAAS